MIEPTLSTAGNFVSAVVQAFLLPAELILSLIGKIAPQAEAIITIGQGGTIAIFCIALAAWTGILVIGLLISRTCLKLTRTFSALIRIAVWHLKMSLGNLKTRLIWKYREYFPHKTKQTQSVSHAQFDDMDIALLASMSRRGPGMATSAPELAEKYKLRPAQIRDRLDRLARNHMLSSVTGSTDGDENYRLTDSGLALIAMCERQAAARVSPASASGSG